MKCLTAKKWISEYIDGELDAAKKTKLDAHCAQCASCQKLREDFRTISTGTKELDSYSPPDSSWGKIRERMASGEQEVLTLPPNKNTWFAFPRLSYVLSAVLLVAFLSLVIIYGPRYWSGQATIPELENTNYTLSKLREAEHHYQMAIKALSEAAMAQKEQLDPQVAEVFRTNLELIDRSIDACRQAVLNNPSDIESRKFLLAAYKEKTDLLNDIMAVKDTPFPARDTEDTI
ncbi:MAG: zf-HC2 domain-containing protein [Candidatus Aminicenantes bacterium]|jgi:predicted anti-sigma-YlaC factor YlaD